MKERRDADEQDSPGHRWVRLALIRPPGSPGTVGVRPHATDPDMAERLWILSERLRYAFLDTQELAKNTQ